VIWTSVGEGAVLFAADRELYYGANEVAAFVWEQLDPADISFADLCEAVHARFPGGDLEQIRSDVIELLEDLERHGLVVADSA
jgi:hypothetical protein